MSISALEKRVQALEAAACGVGGCPRCVGTLIVVEDAVSGEFRSARWNDEEISEEEARGHQTERECPQCGRKLDPENDPVIKVGGR
jgi:hypothetical protein